MKPITGIFTGCASSDDNLCDEIHVRIVDPVIAKHPIWMFPAIAHFQHIKLEKGDRISLELNEGNFVVIKSIKILEKGADPELKPRRRRLRASRHRSNIRRAAVFDKTIGWFKHTFSSGRRFHWLPVKSGPKGGTWIPTLGLSARRYITKKKFHDLVAEGTIVGERPEQLEGKTSVKWGTKK